jgi:hypothetical protein
MDFLDSFFEGLGDKVSSVLISFETISFGEDSLFTLMFGSLLVLSLMETSEIFEIQSSLSWSVSAYRVCFFPSSVIKKKPFFFLSEMVSMR